MTGLRIYEKTTVDQERDVTRFLGSATDDEVEEKECVKDDEEDDEKENKPNKKDLAAMISGNLNNCVLNFYS